MVHTVNVLYLAFKISGFFFFFRFSDIEWIWFGGWFVSTYSNLYKGHLAVCLIWQRDSTAKGAKKYITKCNIFTVVYYILTECSPGLYGENCQGFCSPNCRKTGVCDRVTGHCEGGCQPGWKGKICDTSKDVNSGIRHFLVGSPWYIIHFLHIYVIFFIECDKGMFGNECTRTCGHCFGEEECHHINGTCLKGCKDGLQGTMCIKGKLFCVHYIKH